MSAKPAMTILFGGSFDPVHDGHLKTAEALRHQAGLSCITLLPASRSPLKPEGTADSHRLAMLRLAVADYPGLIVDDRELRRPPPSYTADTLHEFRAELGGASPLVWVIGSDTLASLMQWKDWRSLPDLAHLLVVERPDNPWPGNGEVADWLADLPSVASMDQLQCGPHGKLLQLALPPQTFSSTGIRHELQQRNRNLAKPDGLPVFVWQYILQHDLYLSDNRHEAT